MLHECLFLQFTSLALPITAATAACAAVGGAATGSGMLAIQMLQHQKKGSTNKQTVRTEFRFRSRLAPLQRGVRTPNVASRNSSRSNRAKPHRIPCSPSGKCGCIFPTSLWYCVSLMVHPPNWPRKFEIYNALKIGVCFEPIFGTVSRWDTYCVFPRYGLEPIFGTVSRWVTGPPNPFRGHFEILNWFLVKCLKRYGMFFRHLKFWTGFW